MATPIISIITKVVTKTVASATPSSTVRATPQGGILEGSNPSVYDPKNPIFVFIIQAGIIIIFCRLLHYALSRLRQPRVIAEVIGGVLLGPSVCGHIPGFTNAIFPAASMPALTLAANLGLVLFLFLVGLEVDMRFFLKNWKVALSVGALGMALPFGLGCAIAYGLYHQFHNEPGTVPVSYGVFMLFVGVAMAITAFPVLCRILTELELLSTPVGVIVLSAGVGNDVVGWILLALCVALVNAGSGLTALYVLLVCVGYTLFLAFAVRPAFFWLLVKTGALQNGPSQGIVALTILMVLTSAFFTGVIGIHPIFGGFMIGLICPHEGGFAIKITEKIEDLVGVLFLPLYFALSGLSTNLGLLNNGITWAYVIGVISIAFFAKVTGGTLAARFNGLVWRESFTIGALMSCKGLVELIVLNIGLQAKILSTRTFTIFVVMALVTTFATTPLVSTLYPKSYQIKLESWKRGEIDWDGNRLEDSSSREDSISFDKIQGRDIRRILACVRLDNMPAVLMVLSLLSNSSYAATPKIHREKEEETNLKTTTSPGIPPRPLQVHAVRFMEVTDRDSSVMKVSDSDRYSSAKDPVINTFRTFGQLSQVAVTGAVIVAPETTFASTLTDSADDIAADMVLVPWSGTGTMTENLSNLPDHTEYRFANSNYSHFIASILRNATCNTAIFVDRGFGGNKGASSRNNTLRRPGSSVSIVETPAMSGTISQGHHIFFPYFGSDDDKIALRLVLQLAQNSTVTATIVHFELPESDHGVAAIVDDASVSVSDNPKNSVSVTTHSARASGHSAFFAQLRDSLPLNLTSRVVFSTQFTTSPLSDTLTRSKQEFGQNPNNAGDLMVLGRNSSLNSLLSAKTLEVVPTALGTDARRSLGNIADAVIANVLKASLIIVQVAKDKSV